MTEPAVKVNEWSQMSEQHQSTGTAATSNRFLLWPLMTALTAPLIAGCLAAFVPGLLPIVMLIWALIWGMAGLGALIGLVVYVRRQAWRSAVSIVVLPTIIILSFVFPRPIVGRLLSVGDLLHFWTNRASYLRQIAASPHERGPLFIRFPLEGFMLYPSEIVYDESDEIALPPDQQTQAWRERVGSTSEFVACSYGQSHLHGHFYKVIPNC
jgi:hypothetical protein